MNSNEEFVSIEVAKLLKTKGFDRPCKFYYEWFESDVIMFKGFLKSFSYNNVNHNKENFLNKFSCPTVADAMQWLRNVHKLFVKVDYTTHPITKDKNYYGTVKNMEDVRETVLAFEDALTYEGCANRLLKDALENLDKYCKNQGTMTREEEIQKVAEHYEKVDATNKIYCQKERAVVFLYGIIPIDHLKWVAKQLGCTVAELVILDIQPYQEYWYLTSFFPKNVEVESEMLEPSRLYITDGDFRIIDNIQKITVKGVTYIGNQDAAGTWFIYAKYDEQMIEV